MYNCNFYTYFYLHTLFPLYTEQELTLDELQRCVLCTDSCENAKMAGFMIYSTVH